MQTVYAFWKPVFSEGVLDRRQLASRGAPGTRTPSVGTGETGSPNGYPSFSPVWELFKLCSSKMYVRLED